MTTQVIGIAIGIFIGSLVAAFLFYQLLRRWVRQLVGRSGTTLDNLLLEALEHPLFVAIVLGGIYSALVFLPLPPIPAWLVHKVFSIVALVMVIYIVVRLIDAVLKWYKVDIAEKTKISLDDKIVPVLRVAIPLIAGVLGLVLVLNLAGVNTTPVTNWLLTHGTRIAIIIVVTLAMLFAVSRTVPALLRPMIAKGIVTESEEEVKKRAHTLSRVLITSGQIIIMGIALFTLIAEVGINIGPMLAGVGVFGLAIGFGAQSLVKDVIAGLFIIMENQYRVGDVARIAGVAGLVEDINLRRTVLRDLDGIVHVVPNGEIGVASNFTKEWSRVNMNVSVAYGTDLDHAISVLNRVGKELAEDPAWTPLIIKPPQFLRVDSLGDSGIELKILGDTKPIQQWAVMGELRKRIKKAFDQEGIEIPYPHTKVYFGDTPFPPQPRKRGEE